VTAAGAFELPAEARTALARLNDASPEVLDRLAQGVLRHEVLMPERPLAPFVAAALQVYWTAFASALDGRGLDRADFPSLCPACGSGPVASIVRVGGDLEGLRYLCCGLCSSEWHLVRIKCAQCGATEGIGYYGIEGDAGAVKAETCERCHSYLKVMYMEKDAKVDPVADDLGTLPLDILLVEQGWHRVTPNPFLLADRE
jgi:FdhE protein